MSDNEENQEVFEEEEEESTTPSQRSGGGGGGGARRPKGGKRAKQLAKLQQKLSTVSVTSSSSSAAAGGADGGGATDRIITTQENHGISEVAQATNVRFAHDEKMRLYSRDINLRGVSLSYGGTDLLDGAHLVLAPGHRYGLIGPNGVGKSTLLRHMAAGKLHGFPVRLRTLLVEQEARGSELTAVQVVVQSDTRAADIKRRIAELEAEEELEEEYANELTDLYHDLDTCSAAGGAEGKAETILRGLQFNKRLLSMPTSQLSGGWRMRVSLACALFSKPDLLMLDEPTNHLDLPAILWLQHYLTTGCSRMTLVVVSHDRSFLDIVATDICVIVNKKLAYMPGNYSNYLDKRDQKLKMQQRDKELEDKKKKDIQESIETMKKQARSSGGRDQNMGQIRSKKKQMEKIGGARLIQGSGLNYGVLFDIAWAWGGEALLDIDLEADKKSLNFRFGEPEQLRTSGPLIQLSEVSFKYPGADSKILFHNVTLDVTLSSRILVLGPNGRGKSTLLRVMAGELKPTTGTVVRNNGVRMAFFTQHQIQELPPSLTPVQHLMATRGGMKEDSARSHLGGFGLTGKLAVQPIGTLSGGQKCRLVIAMICLDAPHLLILDEPTNHLDYTSIEALADAVKSFKGGCVIVSHDVWFCSQVHHEHEMWVARNGQIEKYQNEFEDYLDALNARLPV